MWFCLWLSLIGNCYKYNEINFCNELFVYFGNGWGKNYQ